MSIDGIYLSHFLSAQAYMKELLMVKMMMRWFLVLGCPLHIVNQMQNCPCLTGLHSCVLHIFAEPFCGTHALLVFSTEFVNKK